ncbi:PstS family phosphate ABC transporter substrate-binding protein [Planomicrobium okeanokoites]|uniref:Substrate-binding domain-containing protein n=1 Tax=Planomicrobium okeanokoites TaxID=244 RepID=A0ABV7KJ39_PLAOK|nr:substrate-binding domain-containing protein [Planomicrobium okeanokoites]
MEILEMFGRIMMALFIGALIGAMGLLVLLIVALNGDFQFIGLVIAVVISLWLLYLFVDIDLYKKPNGKRIATGIIAFCLLIGAAFSVPHYYKESFAKVDGEVDLYEYEPFTDSEKLAQPDSPSSFKIENDLPKLDGATALYPLYAAFTEAVYPRGQYPPYDPAFSKVVSTTTPEAYDRLIEGKADIIFVAGPSSGQLKKAENLGVELKMTPIGREAFVFFVNSRNPVDGLKSEEIKRIYSGEMTNWSELGGKNDEIRAFQRPVDSGSQTTFLKFMSDTPVQKPEIEEMASGMGGIISEVASYRNYKNAIGYTFRFFAVDMVQNDKIKLLAIDGVEPTIETIRSDEYPMASEFYAVTAGSDNPNIEAFIEWIVSEEGQELVERTGFVSVK